MTDREVKIYPPKSKRDAHIVFLGDDWKVGDKITYVVDFDDLPTISGEYVLKGSERPISARQAGNQFAGHLSQAHGVAMRPQGNGQEFEIKPPPIGIVVESVIIDVE